VAFNCFKGDINVCELNPKGKYVITLYTFYIVQIGRQRTNFIIYYIACCVNVVITFLHFVWWK